MAKDCLHVSEILEDLLQMSLKSIGSDGQKQCVHICERCKLPHKNTFKFDLYDRYENKKSCLFLCEHCIEFLTRIY